MNIKKHDPTFTFMLLLGVVLASVTAVLAAGNIDSTDKWAWGTNVGWINFNPTHGGVSVYSDHLEGYAWGENIGWIRLGTCTGGDPCTYANTSATNYGVNNDGGGNLSGYAWSTDTGWINFDPEGDERVTIDPLTGDFDGYAWGENIGWIHFQNADPAYKVNTAWRASSPVADAGPDQGVAVLSPVTLDGSASTDPDGQLPLTYGWMQSGGPSVTLSDATAVSPTFTAPGVAAVLSFTLVVTDSSGLSDSTPDTVVITVTDSVIVSPTRLTVAEPDGSATFNLRLTNQPNTFVLIALVSSDPGECKVPALVSIRSLLWQTGVTVTVSAVDDALVDGSQPCTVRTTATSGDPTYDGIAIDDVAVTVIDDDSAGVIVDPTSLTVAEPDGSATFNLRLDSQPTDAVTITLASSDPGECSIPASVAIPPVAWQTGMTVTVSAVDDTFADGSQPCTVQTTVTSNDPVYDAIAVDDVAITVTDDDPGVIVDPTRLTVTEPDGRATFTLRLTGVPTDAVTITLASSDPGECSVPASAVIPPIEWQTGVTVTVSAVDDAIEDDSQPCTIYTTAASSDPRYAGIAVDDVDVTVTDDESFVYVYLPVIFRIAP